MPSAQLRQRLLDHIESVRTVDCHSHTDLSTEYAKKKLDLFSMMAYFARDIASVVEQSELLAPASLADDAARWDALKEILDRSRNVSYWRHNIVMYRELFGLEDSDLNDANWQALNRAVKDKTAQPDWYRHVTVDVCGLRTQVKNIPWFESWEPEYFTAVLRMERALMLQQAQEREALSQHTGIEITGLKSAKDSLAALTDEYRERGAVGIKLAHAYRRTLASEPVPEADADRLFARAMAEGTLSPAETKAIEDHLVFFLADLAAQHDLVFQIHTGVQGNWGVIPHSDPLLLIPLLSAFRSVKFDLFHAGYPYSREIGMLGKHFPNVWLNMAWMYVITMAGSRQTLSEWIDLVPGYRLLAFGSDVHYPEFVYAHLVMARSCLADVLADKVDRDFLSEDAALRLAERMLHDNGVELYGLAESEVGN